MLWGLCPHSWRTWTVSHHHRSLYQRPRTNQKPHTGVIKLYCAATPLALCHASTTHNTLPQQKLIQWPLSDNIAIPTQNWGKILCVNACCPTPLRAKTLVALNFPNAGLQSGQPKVNLHIVISYLSSSQTNRNAGAEGIIILLFTGALHQGQSPMVQEVLSRITHRERLWLGQSNPWLTRSSAVNWDGKLSNGKLPSEVLGTFPGLGQVAHCTRSSSWAPWLLAHQCHSRFC